MKTKFKRQAQFGQNIKRTLKEYWRIDRGGLIGYTLASILQVASSLSAIYLSSKLLGQISLYLFDDASNQTLMYQLLVGSIVLLLLENIAWIFMRYLEQSTYLKWQMSIAPVFMERVAAMDLQQFENPESRLALDKVREGYDWKPSHYVTTLLQLGHSLLRLGAVGIAAATLAPWVLPLIVIAGLPMLITQNMEAKSKWGIWQTKGDDKHVYYQLSQLLTNKHSIGEIKILGLGPKLAARCGAMLSSFLQDQRRVMTKYLGVTFAARFCESVAVAGVQIWLLYQLLQRTSGFGIDKFAYYTGVITQFNNSFGLVTGSLAKLYDTDLFMTDYYAFLDIKPQIVVADEPIILSADLLPSIEFKNVSFHYPNDDAMLLVNLNLKVAAGEHVALVGENGAGKSTIIKLLLRFYDVSGGEILIDGHNIKQIDLKSWYRLVGTLFQDFNRYPFSIEENVHLGDAATNLDKPRFKSSTKQAGLLSMVKRLPHGFQTRLSSEFELGIEPSGGQWQRVALARVFYRQANLLILDEPTAAIDAKAEYEIFNDIFKHYKNKGALIVSHRFSTVRKADRIIVLDKGCIIEQGSHEQLLAKAGLYAEMFEKQAEGYR